MAWYVFDPAPIDQAGPVLVGPFPSQAAAAEYANVTHDEDESGNTVVLQAVAPDA